MSRGSLVTSGTVRGGGRRREDWGGEEEPIFAVDVPGTLTTLDTFGKCHRPVFSLCVSQNLHTCENFNSIGRRSCETIMEEKTPLLHEVVCNQVLEFETSIWNSEVSKSNSNILVRHNFFFENDVTSEGAISHNIVYYQCFSVDLYQVSFYFEKLPKVSSAFIAQILWKLLPHFLSRKKNTIWDLLLDIKLSPITDSSDVSLLPNSFREMFCCLDLRFSLYSCLYLSCRVM